MGKTCDLCGDVGNGDLAATCSLCGIHRHVYCMRMVLWEVPNDWFCEECRPNSNAVSPKYHQKDELSKALTSKPEIVHRDTTCFDNSMQTVGCKRQKIAKSGKVKLIPTEEAIMLTSGSIKMDPPLRKSLGKDSCQSTRMASISKKTPSHPKTASIKFLSFKLESDPTFKPSRLVTSPKHFSVPDAQASKELKEAKTPVAFAKKSFSREQANQAPKLANERATSYTKVEKVTDKASCVSSPSMHVLPIDKSGGNSCTNAEISKSAVEENIMLSNQQTLQNYIPNLPRTEATWKGTFEIFSSATPGKLYEGFVAHPPSRVHQKAYKFSKLMPSVLQFKMLPRCNIWADIFQDDYPDGDDVALYIIPEDFERSLPHYICLLEAMEIHDMVMCSYMGGGVEFLIFTSKLLHMDFQKTYTKSFLWGVFRCVKAKAITEEPREAVPLLAYDLHREENYEVDMEIDMIGGKDV